MSDKKNIENWAKSNRDVFDDKELPVGHRELFEKKLDNLLHESKPQKTKFHWYKIAAVLVVGLTIISSAFYFNNHRIVIKKYASTNNLVEVENKYSEKIKEALVPVRASKKYLSPEYRSFLKEMEKLDTKNERLKELLIEFPDDERILNSIIENYKSRLQLLEQLKVIMSNKHINKIESHGKI